MSHLRRAASGGAQVVRPATIPEMAKAARLELVGVVGAKDPIAHLGGCLNVSRLLTLASINQEDDGNLVEDDMEAAQELALALPRRRL